MALVIDCPCGAHLEIDNKFAGQSIQCPDCQRPLQAPTLESRPARTSGLALASLILALVGAFTVVGTLIAVVLGALGLRSIARNPDRLKGNGYAVAGIILGVLLTAVSLFAYLRVEIFGLDRWLREPQWAGKLDFRDSQFQEKGDFTMSRPSKNWGVYLDRAGKEQGHSADFEILVNVRDDAYAIGFFFSKDQLVDKLDVYRETAIRKFIGSELVRLLARKLPVGEPKILSTQQIPGPMGREPQEVQLEVRLGRYERTFILRVLPGPDSLFVVAAGTRKSRFPGLELELRKIVAGFKLNDRAGF